jgi:predicted HD phosphohydrolase
MTSQGIVGLSPLARPEWRHVEKPALENFRAADWELLNGQRKIYYAERQAAHVLQLLAVSERDPSFGYRINNYRHCLQSATMVMRAGLDEEAIVVALLHDIGFVACPSNHGLFAAALLGGYVSERHRWMLAHHQVFQQLHFHELEGPDPKARDKWRGHPHFHWAADFVERFDQNAIDPDYATAPLEHFVPMVHRIFERAPRSLPVD